MRAETETMRACRAMSIAVPSVFLPACRARAQALLLIIRLLDALFLVSAARPTHSADASRSRSLLVLLIIQQLLLKTLTTRLVLRAPDHPAAVCTRPTIISYRIIIYRVRVSTPSTQNPDERARSDRAHATPGRVGAA